MTLGELIAALESLPADRKVAHGFTNPHSYRGYYNELAFEPASDVTVGSMLADARGALGSEFTGYKGGEYTMDEDTPCHLAEYGCTGEPLGGAHVREWSRADDGGAAAIKALSEQVTRLNEEVGRAAESVNAEYRRLLAERTPRPPEDDHPPRQEMTPRDIAEELRAYLRPIETRTPQARMVGDVRVWQLSSLCLVAIDLIDRQTPRPVPEGEQGLTPEETLDVYEQGSAELLARIEALEAENARLRDSVAEWEGMYRDAVAKADEWLVDAQRLRAAQSNPSDPAKPLLQVLRELTPQQAATLAEMLDDNPMHTALVREALGNAEHRYYVVSEGWVDSLRIVELAEEIQGVAPSGLDGIDDDPERWSALHDPMLQAVYAWRAEQLREGGQALTTAPFMAMVDALRDFRAKVAAAATRELRAERDRTRERLRSLRYEHGKELRALRGLIDAACEELRAENASLRAALHPPTVDRRAFLQSQGATLLDMIARAPESASISKLSLEARLDQVREELAAEVAPQSLFAWTRYPANEMDYFVVGSEEEAKLDALALLNDYCDPEPIHDILVLPCAIAFPPASAFDGARMVEDLSDDGSDVAGWSDFAQQEEPAITATNEATRALDAMLAATFQRWAEAHGVHARPEQSSKQRAVEISAWKFTGPPRRFVYDVETKTWSEKEVEDEG